MKEALARFKKNPSSYIFVGVLCGLLFVLFAVLNIIDSAMLLITIPLLLLPSLFASHVSCYYLEANEPITFRAFFHYYVGFFRPQFRGSFRGISAFLKAIGIYIIFFIFSYIFFYLFFQNRYGEEFITAYWNLFGVSSDAQSIDFNALMSNYTIALYEENSIMYRFVIYTSAGALPFAITFYVYFISFASLSIYYRTNINSASGALLRLAVINAYTKNGRRMRRDWFKLNWPLLILSLVGAFVGAVVAKFLLRNIDLISPFILIGAVLFIAFFLPFSHCSRYLKRNPVRCSRLTPLWRVTAILY